MTLCMATVSSLLLLALLVFAEADVFAKDDAFIKADASSSDGVTCRHEAEHTICGVTSLFEFAGDLATLNAALTCPQEPQNFKPIIEVSRQGLCECDAAIVLDESGNTQPMDCECFMCPPSSTFAVAYQCATEIAGFCKSFDCDGTCNGNNFKPSDDETENSTQIFFDIVKQHEVKANDVLFTTTEHSCDDIVANHTFAGTCCTIKSTDTGGCYISVQNGLCLVSGPEWSLNYSSVLPLASYECPEGEYTADELGITSNRLSRRAYTNFLMWFGGYDKQRWLEGEANGTLIYPTGEAWDQFSFDNEVQWAKYTDVDKEYVQHLHLLFDWHIIIEEALVVGDVFDGSRTTLPNLHGNMIVNQEKQTLDATSIAFEETSLHTQEDYGWKILQSDAVIVPPALRDNTMKQLYASLETYSDMVTLIRFTGMEKQVNDFGVTLLIPSNDAFAKAGVNVSNLLTAEMYQHTTNFLKSHMLQGIYNERMFSNETINATTFLGTIVSISSAEDGLFFQGVNASSYKLTRNAIFYELVRPLYPATGDVVTVDATAVTAFTSTGEIIFDDGTIAMTDGSHLTADFYLPNETCLEGRTVQFCITRNPPNLAADIMYRDYNVCKLKAAHSYAGIVEIPNDCASGSLSAFDEDAQRSVLCTEVSYFPSCHITMDGMGPYIPPDDGAPTEPAIPPNRAFRKLQPTSLAFVVEAGPIFEGNEDLIYSTSDGKRRGPILTFTSVSPMSSPSDQRVDNTTAAPSSLPIDAPTTAPTPTSAPSASLTIAGNEDKEGDEIVVATTASPTVTPSPNDISGSSRRFSSVVVSAIATIILLCQ